MVSSIDTIRVSSSSIAIGRIVGKCSASFSHQAGGKGRLNLLDGEWRCPHVVSFVLFHSGRKRLAEYPWTPDDATSYQYRLRNGRRRLIIFSWQLLSGVVRVCVFRTRCPANNAAMLGLAWAIEQLNLISVMDSDRNANYSAGTSGFELLARIPRGTFYDNRLETDPRTSSWNRRPRISVAAEFIPAHTCSLENYATIS